MLRERPVFECGRLCHGNGGPRVGSPAPEGVDVGYPPDQRIQAVDKLGFRAFLKAERLKVIARV